LSTSYNAQYIYYDIYLDTPDFTLFKNQYSLRFRKRNFGAAGVTYSLQLKSEMDTGSSVRMEVDEPDLNLYKIKTAKGWITLTSALDVFFHQIETKSVDPQSAEIRNASANIQTWIAFKVGGTVAPFQKLLHLNLPGLDSVKMKTLSPVLFGSETRKRSDVYIDTANTTAALKKTEMNHVVYSDKSSFLQHHPGYNWIMETSLDSAIFYPLVSTSVKRAVVYEFEVENKYFIPETGSKIMDLFEAGLKKYFLCINEKDSKYCRSLKKFQGH
jgi:hypothetical protein